MATIDRREQKMALNRLWVACVALFWAIVDVATAVVCIFSTMIQPHETALFDDDSSDSEQDMEPDEGESRHDKVPTVTEGEICEVVANDPSTSNPTCKPSMEGSIKYETIYSASGTQLNSTAHNVNVQAVQAQREAIERSSIQGRKPEGSAKYETINAGLTRAKEDRNKVDVGEFISSTLLAGTPLNPPAHKTNVQGQREFTERASKQNVFTQPTTCTVDGMQLKSIAITAFGNIKFPYNCKMCLNAKQKWYAVAKGRGPGIYSTWEETDFVVSRFSGAKHQSFRAKKDAELWLNREFIDIGYKQESPHRQNVECLGVDKSGHSVFKCVCCSEVFCDNGHR